MLRKWLVIGLGMAVLLSATTGFAGDVFVTKQGKKYHQAQCALITNKDTTAMDESKALEAGYKPCRKCIGKDGTVEKTTKKKAPAAKTKKSSEKK